MSTMKFAINNILPNPYQTRENGDLEHIQELAVSIAKHGILQPPTGRLSTTQPGKPEIAFGHNRLAALKLLNSAGIDTLKGLNIEVQTPEELNRFTERFKEMEIEIKVLSDLEMFELAVTENNRRKDLNPIEEARAMMVYRDHFEKNSDEIGELFKMTGAAVRNKMRLLDLPEKYISLVESGVVTEGVAREILAISDFPEEAVSKLSTYDYHLGKYVPFSEYIENEASAGTLRQDSVREVISNFISRNCIGLDKKPWKHTEELYDIEAKPLPVCKGCPKYLQRDKKEICMSPDCFKAKTIAWQTQYLLQASLLSSIPVLEHTDEEFKNHTEFSWDAVAALKQIKSKGGCENLRLVYREPSTYRGDGSAKITNMIDQGFPNAMIVCTKKEGFCTCLRAIKAGIQTANENNEQLSEAQLKEVRRQISDQKKMKRELNEGLVKQGALALQKGFDAKTLLTFQKVFLCVSPYNLQSNSDFQNATTIEELTGAVCQSIIQMKVNEDSPESTLFGINSFLEQCGLDPLDINLNSGSKNPIGDNSTPEGEYLQLGTVEEPSVEAGE